MGGIEQLPDEELPVGDDGCAPPKVPTEQEMERRIRESDARRKALEGGTPSTTGEGLAPGWPDPQTEVLEAGEGTHGSDTDPIAEILKEAGLTDLPDSPSAFAVEKALLNLVKEVSGVGRLRLTGIRNAAIELLKGRKVNSPAMVVDAALGKAPGLDEPLHGQGLVFVDPEPWPEPVDGAELLDEVSSVFTRYLILPQGAAPAAALWVVHTYLIDILQVSPLLALTSPQKRCGKTTVLDLLQSLCRRALGTSNISGPALFRIVEQVMPTLLIDEADTFLAEHDELRGMINSGYTRSTARVIRTVGENFEPRAFGTFCPKAIAAINTLPDTIEDRSVVVRMKRRAPGEQVERLRRDRLDAQLEPLRQKTARWAADIAAEVRNADPEVPASLNDRASDIWRPLLAIADSAAHHWPEQARKAALALTSTEAAADSDVKILLLTDLRDIFDQLSATKLFSETLVDRLLKLDSRPWAEWRKGRPLTQNGLSRLLRPFEIQSKSIRIGADTAKGYERADLEDTFSRYIPAEEGNSNRHTVTTPDSTDQSPPFEPSHDEGVLRFENARNPLGDKACDGVTVAGPDAVENGVF